ncbi:S24 family peptidase [Aureimonas altamirensis]|jgi:phage repressor protein C with HTH and peptisase S24 domain|uniref:S24 family peptidase n=1 Tax=Aureimonas altamirensis TaxID=370622 RepID=UPI0030198719
MLSNDEWWAAIDRLAETRGLTPSALARQAGLDATSFNKSKRRSGDGRPRWPSTESVAKVLSATGTSMEDFLGISRPVSVKVSLPLATGAHLTDARQFGSDGPVAGPGAMSLDIKIDASSFGTYALEVGNERQFAPRYAEGDILLLTPDAAARPGDRVLAVLYGDDFIVGTIRRNAPGRVEIAPLDPALPVVRFARKAIRHMARIAWASQ